MGEVIDLKEASARKNLEEWNPEGWWIISINLPNCENKVEYRENHGVMVYAKSFRELPALIEQGRKLLAREASVRASMKRRQNHEQRH